MKLLPAAFALAAVLALAAPAAAFPGASGGKTPSGHSSSGGGAPEGGPKGKVLETMNSGGYTYLRVKTAEGEVWAAIPQSEVKKGQRVSLQPGMPMADFTSKSLKRTFKSIVFSGGLAGGGAGMPARGGAVKPKAEKVKVAKAAGKDAYTVAELYGKKKSLAGKTALVRGQVVKFSPGIMKRNWVHLQDGTGDFKKGTHDLVVTTQDSAAVGDIATFAGTVAADKDFGMGYSYSVLLEDAGLRK